jgi:hypothetical protein
MLAIRPVDGAPSSKLFRLNTFWIFTVMGMSLPYRIWFARHCDQLRVTVVKETYAELAPKSTFMSSWFTSKMPSTPTTPGMNSSVFREQMQSLLLYAKETNNNLPVETNVSLPTLNNTTKASIQDVPPVKFGEASDMQNPNATKADQLTRNEDEVLQKENVMPEAVNTETLETQEAEKWNSYSTGTETNDFKEAHTALNSSDHQEERPSPILDTSLEKNCSSVVSSTNNHSKERKEDPNDL